MADTGRAKIEAEIVLSTDKATKAANEFAANLGRALGGDPGRASAQLTDRLRGQLKGMAKEITALKSAMRTAAQMTSGGLNVPLASRVGDRPADIRATIALQAGAAKMQVEAERSVAKAKLDADRRYTAEVKRVANILSHSGPSAQDLARAQREAAQVIANNARQQRTALLTRGEGEMYANQQAQRRYGMLTGNPFQVIAEVVQRVSGVQKLQDAMEQGRRDVQVAMRNIRKAGTNAQLLAAAEAELAAAETRSATARGRAMGTPGIMAGIKDFALSNIITSGLLFTSFQLISEGVSAIATAADKAINPAKYLAEAIKGVASASESAGGGGAYAKQLGFSEGGALASALNQIQAANQFQTTVDGLVAAIESSTGDLNSLSTSYVDKLGRALKLEGGSMVSSTLSGIPYNADLNAQNAPQYKDMIMQFAAADASAFGLIGLQDEYSATLKRLLDSGVVYVHALDMAAEETLKVALQQARLASTKSSLEMAGTRMQEIGFQLGGPAITPTQKAQERVNAAQNRLQRMQNGMQSASQNSAIASAQRAVGQAGVAGSGDTVFDVANRIIQAQAQADDVKRQQATQNGIARATDQVAKAQKDLAKVELQQEAQKLQEESLAALKQLSSADRQSIQVEFKGSEAKYSKAVTEFFNTLFTLANSSGTGYNGPH